MRTIATPLISALLLAVIPTALAAPSWLQPDYVEKAFIEVAFKREYRKGIYPLARWVRPIHYYIRFNGVKPLPLLTNAIEQHMRRLSRITGHPIRRTQDPLKANVQIILTRDRHYKKEILQRVTNPDMANLLSQTSNCMANFRTNSRHEIFDAWVIIPADHAFKRGLFHACVVEELTQIMGMPNDSDWVNPSIANDHSTQQELSPLDIRFLKLLYSPELKPGMTVEQARPILRRLIRRMR